MVDQKEAMDCVAPANTGAAAKRLRAAPPAVPFVLSIGVTGHRSELLEGASNSVSERLAAVFADVVATSAKIAEDHSEFFAASAPRVTLVSPLAEGADQMAARIALDRGCDLQVVLPFARDEYVRDFRDAAARTLFAESLARASRVLELPGSRADPLHAYVMAGRATVAHCDLLIAVWDGEPPRGRGGTGEIVEIALLAGTPIIHVPIDPDAAVTILWSDFDPHVFTTRQNSHAAARAFDRAAIEEVLNALLSPPSDPRERAFIGKYYAERERRLNARVEYPLLLALTGVKRVTRSVVHAPALVTAMASEWLGFRKDCQAGHGVSADIDPLQDAYCWSDQLAQHFAQTYRSGHIFNFAVGAAAVLVALLGLILPGAKLLLAVTELAMIVAVMLNTRVGTNREWHRRWLDYRQLAERLRPMRSLKLLGIAAPRIDSNVSAAGRRWTDWYAAGMWRAMGCPQGTINNAEPLAKALASHELRPQIEFHRAAARQAEKFDHRLHLFSAFLFALTVTGCLVLIIGYLVAPEWVARYSKVFVFLSAGLPAVGTAIFGIRVQGDFTATALRSNATALRLEGAASQVEGKVDLSRAADVFEQAAHSMSGDLREWRLAHQQRELVIPG